MTAKSTRSRKAIKVCIVALDSSPLLLGGITNCIQGPQVQSVYLANEFVKRDIDVSIISFTNGGVNPPLYVNGIKVIALRQSNSRLRMLNIFSLLVNLLVAMLKADADVYLHVGDAPAGGVSLICRLTNKKFILNIASDVLVDRGQISRNIKEFNLSKLGLLYLGNLLDIWFASAIVVQSKRQKDLLESNFRRQSNLIRMPFPLTNKAAIKKSSSPIVLWVGSIAEVKQPELFINLARAIPEAQFQMMGGYRQNRDLFDKILALSGDTSNFEYLGVIPFSQTDKYFARATILVNTSIFEGFPNAFIQAWMNFTPVVSLNSNPDEILTKYKMGFCSKTFSQLVEDVKTLLNDVLLRTEMGNNGHDYVEKKHEASQIINEYIRLFHEVLTTINDGNKSSIILLH